MTDIDILSALNYRLSEFLATNPIDVSRPNEKYKPSEGTGFIKVDFLPATTETEAIGQGAKTRHTGIYQLMLTLPKYESFSKAKGLIDGLKTFFKMSTAIVYNGVALRVTKFQVNQHKDDDTWFYQPVSIYYRTDLINE